MKQDIPFPCKLDFDKIFMGKFESDEVTRQKLTQLVINHSITEEQVEVVWAFTHDLKAVENAARFLDYGTRFPDDDLGDLCVFIRRCIGNKWDNGDRDVLADIKEGIATIAAATGFKTGDVVMIMNQTFEIFNVSVKDAIINIKKLNEAMQNIDNSTPKNRKGHRASGLRKKHVPPAADRARLRKTLPKQDRRSHVHQRRG